MAFWYQVVYVIINNMLLKVSLVPPNRYVNVKPLVLYTYIHYSSRRLYNSQELAKFITLAHEADKDKAQTAPASQVPILATAVK